MHAPSPVSVRGLRFRTVALSDNRTLEMFAKMLHEHSWPPGYPVSAIDEVHDAEFIVCAYAVDADNPVGFMSVNRYASPDGIDNVNCMWLAGLVLLPEYRSMEIMFRLYRWCLDFLKVGSDRILTCTEKPVIERYLKFSGWRKVRQTYVRGRIPTVVYELDKRFACNLAVALR